MIARLWRGWTSRENADAYERLLRERVTPGLKLLDGYRGGYILRQESNEEVEFVVMNLFESLEAVRAFAGPEYTVPVFEPGNFSPKSSQSHAIMRSKPPQGETRRGAS